MNCLLKKFLLKQANKLLEDYKGNLNVAREKVGTWLARARVITAYLQSLSDKLEDSHLTDEELEAAVNELKPIIDQWKSV